MFCKFFLQEKTAGKFNEIHSGMVHYTCILTRNTAEIDYNFRFKKKLTSFNKKSKL